MKRAILIATLDPLRIELSDDSIYSTVEDYDAWKDDPEAVMEILQDAMHDHAAIRENWTLRLEEKP